MEVFWRLTHWLAQTSRWTWRHCTTTHNHKALPGQGEHLGNGGLSLGRLSQTHFHTSLKFLNFQNGFGRFFLRVLLLLFQLHSRPGYRERQCQPIWKKGGRCDTLRNKQVNNWTHQHNLTAWLLQQTLFVFAMMVRKKMQHDFWPRPSRGMWHGAKIMV